MKNCPRCHKTFDDQLEVCPDDGSTLMPVEDPMLGKLLAGRYLLTEKLGAGGMGAVYKTTHTQMDRICAIKVLHPLTSDARAAVERFKREAKMASRIDNSHAVMIYDFGEAENGMLYLAMEYVDGQALTRVLAREWPLGIERVVRITTQIAEALAAAHSLGIVHRDLKPDNIMLTRKGTDADYVKVLDFGIAKTNTDDGDNLTKTGFVVGTPIYMSPEQLSGERVDSRSDVYSFALIVYEMLSGRLPFSGSNSQALTIQRIVADPIPLRANAPSMSEALERAVMAGLTRKPEPRVQTVTSFAAGIVSAVNEGTQAIGSLKPGPVSHDNSEHATMSFLARDTVIDSVAGHGEAQLPPGAQAGASDSPHDAPTLPVGTAPMNRDIAPREPTADHSIPSPSAFVTRPSLAPPQAAQFQQPDQTPTPPDANWPTASPRQPASPPAPAASSGGTLGMGSMQQTPPTAQMQQIPPTAQMPFQPFDQTTRTPKSGKLIAVAGAVVVIALIGLAVAAFVLYPRLTRPSGNANVPAQAPNQNASGRSPASTGETGSSVVANEQAQVHYEAGKKRQEQAYSLAEAGARQEAIDESNKAIAEYRQAIAARPLFPEAHENLAVALYNAGQLEESLVEYRLAIQQYTDKSKKPTAQVVTNYGLALFDLKRYPEAADAFARALEIDPRDEDLYAHRGFALQNAGDQSGAKEAYRKYLSVAPSGQYAAAIREILAGRAQPPTESGNQGK